MLRVYLHAGGLDERNLGNQLASIDIAYAKKSALADYLVGMNLRGHGEVEPDYVLRYPRWSASLWDLVARALTRLLYRADQAPASAKPDKRCAYATRMCAVMERTTLDRTGVILGTATVTQLEGQRGHYTAILDEDINGRHVGHFVYGSKRLDAVDLLLRAICWALFDKDTLGPYPALVLPPTLQIDGEDRFHVEALAEPAKTGFARYSGINFPSTVAPDPLAKAQDYVNFLMQG
ncbi:hypothetical protein [Alicycliphilus denitrificans]|uniref:Uncharacterized protein n=1 Tax=Alicycliphilus denitrificans TaxID=179636 RepID=A0A3R7EX88_9BURK|nr:hypothetical protein [Alicycliphilus denitrificans]RKJ94542.1 hypothetical protein CE154_019705 [Alicycliphilus denitrificans]